MNSTQHLMEVSVCRAKRGKHRARSVRYQFLPQELAGKPARGAGIPASSLFFLRLFIAGTEHLW